ncbi:hypothetical protein MTO96_009534 [Rhipicephalus appendiculatus]
MDQYLPDLLARIDVAVMMALKHSSSAASYLAIDGKDMGYGGLEASPQSETMAAVKNQAVGKEDKNCNGTRNIVIEDSRQSENLSAVEQSPQ